MQEQLTACLPACLAAWHKVGLRGAAPTHHRPSPPHSLCLTLPHTPHTAGAGSAGRICTRRGPGRLRGQAVGVCHTSAPAGAVGRGEGLRACAHPTGSTRLHGSPLYVSRATPGELNGQPGCYCCTYQQPCSPNCTCMCATPAPVCRCGWWMTTRWSPTAASWR